MIYAIFSPYYPDSYYLTDEYEVRTTLQSLLTFFSISGHLSHCLKCTNVSFPQAQPFWYRCVFILLWAKVILYKYVSCWVIAVSNLLICKYVHEVVT